jgi:polyisoprenoid-binding protein YceI
MKHCTTKLCVPVAIVALLPFGLRAAADLMGPSAEARAPAAAYEVDAVHSSGVFRAKHLVSPFWGSFHGISGTVSYDASTPEQSTVDIKIAAASISSGNAKRDEHLRSPDFFSVKEFPEIRFKSTRVVSKGDKKLEMSGDLTLHGQTKPVTAAVEVTGEGQTDQGYKAGFEATIDLERSEFGMSTGLPDVGDEVRVIIALQCVKKG